MAQQRGRRSSSNRSTSKRRTNSGGARKSSRKKNTNDYGYLDDIILFGGGFVAILLFLSNFGLIGSFGTAVSNVMFGLVGFWAYILPLVIFGAGIYTMICKSRPGYPVKMIAGVIFYSMLCCFCALKRDVGIIGHTTKDFYDYSAQGHYGGGILGGFLGYGLYSFLGTIGAYLMVIVLLLASFALLTEKSIFAFIKNRIMDIAEYQRAEREARMEEADALQEIRTAKALQRKERKKARIQEQAELLRRERKVSGVADSDVLNLKDTTEKPTDTASAKANNATVSASSTEPQKAKISDAKKPASPRSIKEGLSEIRIHGLSNENDENIPEHRQFGAEIGQDPMDFDSSDHGTVDRTPRPVPEARPIKNVSTPQPAEPVTVSNASENTASEPAIMIENKPKRPYRFPPLSLLKKSERSNGDTEDTLRNTALRLQQTLETFGVNVKVTDIMQGPTVTRYELQPEIGVKVSKIVGLADDIKLNLAATDIRIEAPIPGKSAVGIEVPNSKTSAVGFRDLLESSEFKEFSSNLAFAVGKDISGHTIVSDIGKMPHLLIAGATGSGKSVCINTIIMSLIYKSKPEDVRMILIDPKVVELSVYNGIPHLLIPVVTDPKKAAAALHWGVAEMTDRYKKFAELNVRDLKAYNAKVETMTENDGQPIPEKLPQIVIIVDELADLMMVAPGEVEESICRLAQLARACGIHLVIATQRPSVDVITGLIKANMPSRIAFAVSSGVDSRTILDMVGAEKLLGKGDMLYFPQGIPKPERLQGAFISDNEVASVVEFLKKNCGADYAPDMEQQLSSASAVGAGFTADANDRDQYFTEAGNFIIDKEKASIGMLQRVFKIGFNRAARIMDQLEEAGVVGPEEGTKPRKVLMSKEQFENFLETEG
ncbi:MAG: DNA translocase FtsK [Lachnospiraceae bacterium]|nr:DNA translocase FtsK [Lachnospiraceae bacterium]